jgi:hypothetical protein
MLMNTDIRSSGVGGSSSSAGGTTLEIVVIRPSAGDKTKPGDRGIVRWGSRKKYSIQAVIPLPNQVNFTDRRLAAAVTRSPIATNGKPAG